MSERITMNRYRKLMHVAMTSKVPKEAIAYFFKARRIINDFQEIDDEETTETRIQLAAVGLPQDVPRRYPRGSR